MQANAIKGDRNEPGFRVDIARPVALASTYSHVNERRGIRVYDTCEINPLSQ